MDSNFRMKERPNGMDNDALMSQIVKMDDGRLRIVCVSRMYMVALV